MRVDLAGNAIINERNELLLLWKISQSHWEFPGGGIEPGETPEHAAIREAKEEIGVDVIIEQSLGSDDFAAAGRLFRGHMFIAHIKDGQVPDIKEPKVFGKLLWMPIDRYEYYPLAPNVMSFCEQYLQKNN